MPSMVNITIQDAANADVTWTATVPSAGDKSPAVWRSNSVSSVPAYRPEVSLVMKSNGRQNGRIFSAKFRFPVTAVNPVTGATALVATVPFQVNGTLPTNVDVATLNDAYTQFGRLISSALFRACAAEGYAAS